MNWVGVDGTVNINTDTASGDRRETEKEICGMQKEGVRETVTYPRVIPSIMQVLRRDLQMPAHLLETLLVRASFALQTREEVGRVDDVEC